MMEINQTLTNANIAYRMGDPIMSDTEYDRELEAYIEASTSSEIDIRRQLMDIPGKVKHSVMIGSFKKITAGAEELLSWWESNKTANLGASAKIDGMALVAEFHQGKFVQATTRGDGEYGENQTDKCRYIIDDIDNEFTGTIRGELTMTYESFEKLKKIDKTREHKNIRNSTVGIIGHKTCHPELCKLIKFVAYEIVGHDDNRFKQLLTLQSWRFMVPQFIWVDTSMVTDDRLVAIYNTFRDAAPYMVDGLVIHSTDWVSENDKYYPSAARAFKVNDTNERSEVIDIEWNLGKTGKLTPIVIIEPVELNGTTVSRASAYNGSYIFDKGIVRGSIVTVQKSGDIIPCIIKVEKIGTCYIDDVKCPVCGHTAEWDENKTHLMCTNHNCAGKIMKQLESFIIKLGIEGITEKSLTKFGIKSFDDLYNFIPDPNYKKQVKLNTDIREKIFRAPITKLYQCLTWPGAGRKTIGKIIEHYGLEGFEGMMNTDGKSLWHRPLPAGVGVITLEHIYSVFKSNQSKVMAITSTEYYNPIIENKVVLAAATGMLEGKSYCVSGKTQRSRVELQNIIKDNGGKIASVSGKLTALVIGDNCGPAKLKKCETLGVQVMTEEYLLQLLGIE